MALNIPLRDGDTINVPKAQSASCSGHVKTLVATRSTKG